MPKAKGQVVVVVVVGEVVVGEVVGVGGGGGGGGGGWGWGCKYQPKLNQNSKTSGVQAEALVASDNTYGMWAEASWRSRASGAGDKCRRPGSVARGGFG